MYTHLSIILVIQILEKVKGPGFAINFLHLSLHVTYSSPL